MSHHIDVAEARRELKAMRVALQILAARLRLVAEPAISDNQIMAIYYMHRVREVRLWQSRAMSREARPCPYSI
jgi:hypothetical protein